MRTAIFAAEVPTVTVVAGAEIFGLEEAGVIDLNGYDAVLLIGSSRLDEQSVLSAAALERLWRYVEQGGLLYGELISAFDFPSSRLFGWKQDFAKSRRTLEKLRVTDALAGKQSSDAIASGTPGEAARQAGIAAGELLEWSGAVSHGFVLESTVLLEFGGYKETHCSDGAGTRSYPALLLKEIGAGKVLYATFSLWSCQRKEMLRPYCRWEKVVPLMSAAIGIPLAMWKPTIGIAGEQPPETAVRRNAAWFASSGILPAADGSEGVFENIHSVMAELAKDRRPDCHAQVALMLHLYGRWSGDSSYEKASRGLMNYLFDNHYQDTDPSSPSYGFFKWFDYPGRYPDQMFTDDNAWVCFVLMYLYRRTGEEIYLEHGLLLAEALLETQRPDGLRAEVLRRKGMEQYGREGAAGLEASMNPHFESIAHAAFIQAYLSTGREAFVEAAMRGSLQLLEHMRADRLKFMYSRTSGLSRFLLPLGYLSRRDASGAIAKGISSIVEYLAGSLHRSGAVEERDNPDPDRFGIEDAGVYIRNGEGIADQLYTNNFLLMNLWELWKASGDGKHREMYDGVARFMCGIQIASPDSRYDGGWMRAFDLNSGEYYGNNGDTGWGPYCMESGWTNGIASAGLLLMLLDESVFQ